MGWYDIYFLFNYFVCVGHFVYNLNVLNFYLNKIVHGGSETGYKSHIVCNFDLNDNLFY